MLLKVKEIKSMDNGEIITRIFHHGIIMSGDKGSNQTEENLKRLFRELGARGVIENWEEAYERTNC